MKYLFFFNQSSPFLIRNLKEINNNIKILIFTIIGLLILIIILFIFYKFFLNYYIRSRNILYFNNNDINTLKKHYLFQKILDCNTYSSDEEEICPICIQKFNKQISKVCKTPCQHIFHFYCLKKYVFESNNNICFSCPLCKKEYLEENNINLEGIRDIPLDENDNPIYENEKIENINNNIKVIKFKKI